MIRPHLTRSKQIADPLYTIRKHMHMASDLLPQHLYHAYDDNNKGQSYASASVGKNNFTQRFGCQRLVLKLRLNLIQVLA